METLIRNLPDEEAARRFFRRLTDEQPTAARRLERDEALLSDLLSIAAFSPLLATTILQNPEYLPWLKRARKDSTVKGKDEFLESLARFDLTNSKLETGVLLARYRRRELIRIYLKDIRGIDSIAEVTEEISNLADAILEHSLNVATQQLENKHGQPLALDEKGKQIQASFCVVALGKLGSKELNYSSDIDLLFLYSHEGNTSDQGTRGSITNREYFIKLAELVIKLVGNQTGEGSAYRVDMRLRPHGRVGKLALSTGEATKYYLETAQLWERQVLIRSRVSAGDAGLFGSFFLAVEPYVFSVELSANEALMNVRLSKEKINAEKQTASGFDVKLGHGGIREIEFIAQALQLAYGGTDKWLRSSHTLISLARLADRALISETELTLLFDAYKFLRRLEHRLQMEHGLQTHMVPDNMEKRLVISQRMGIHFVADFNTLLAQHTNNVSTAFTRIFGKRDQHDPALVPAKAKLDSRKREDRELNRLFMSIEKSEAVNVDKKSEVEALKMFSRIAPPFARLLTANPLLVETLPDMQDEFAESNFDAELFEVVMRVGNYAGRLSEMRRIWSRMICRIAAFEVFGKLEIHESRVAQTHLAENSIKTAVAVAKDELQNFYGQAFGDFPFAVLGLGKLGGGGMDFGSDLDLVIVYDEELPCPVESASKAEFYAKAVEYFVTSLSSMTRDGSLYRVDLRLRPDGKRGATSIAKNALNTYLNERAAVWELLAYVKLRGIHGENGLALETESMARDAILQTAAGIDRERLRAESLEIRLRLEEQKSLKKRKNEVDIKFGEGGLQDVYFAIRYLQLRDGVPDDPENRSTSKSLQKLRDNESMSLEDFMRLKHGYVFLSLLDHHLRLSIGRSNRLQTGDKESLIVIAERMQFDSPDALLAELSTHRINIRDAFESVFDQSV